MSKRRLRQENISLSKKNETTRKKIAANKDQIERLSEYIEKIKNGEVEQSDFDETRKIRIAIRERDKRDIEKWLVKNEPQFKKEKENFYASATRLQQYEQNDKNISSSCPPDYF